MYCDVIHSLRRALSNGIVSICRWQRADGTNRYDVLVPDSTPPQDDGETGEDGAVATKKVKSKRDTIKGALFHAYDFNVHQFITHLRRVRPGNPPLNMNVGGKMIPVKAWRLLESHFITSTAGL